MSKVDRIYNKQLKQIQKAHKPEKWERRRPYNWKKEWGPFIKYDADWDGAYLLDLIIFKLEKMYIGLDNYSNEVREDLDKRLAVLKKTIELGKKLQTYDYDEDYHQWGKIHCAHVILVYKRSDGFLKGKPIHKFVHWQAEEEKEDQDVYERLEGYFGRKEVDQWAKENGYDPKELSIAYSGEWDDKANYKIWKKKVRECNRIEQKDTDEFFKLISRNYRGWWW